MDTTPIKTHMNFFGTARLIDFLLNSSASIPVNLANKSGGLYYNSSNKLLTLTDTIDSNKYIPYLLELPNSTKLALLSNTGKISTVNNDSTNKLVYLNSSGTVSLSQYITKDWLHPELLTTTIIESDNVIPTSKAVYDAIEAVNSTIGDYLPLTGGILSGALYMGNGNGVPIKFIQNTNLVGSIWSANGNDIRIDTSDEIVFSIRDYPTDTLGGAITFEGDYTGKYFNIISAGAITDFKSKIIGFTEINLRDDNLITFDTQTTHIPKLYAINTDSEDQITIESLHTLITNGSGDYFHISGNVLTGSSGTSIGLVNNKIKYIYNQELYVDTIILPSNNSTTIKYFNDTIKTSLDANSSNTLLSETAIFNAINNKLSLATTVKDGIIPMLPTDGELYYLNGDNLWIEKEWVVSTIDGKKYLSTGVGDFKSFNVSLIANGEISIGSEYLILETIPTTDPNIADSAYPTGLYIGRISTKPSSAGSSLYVAGSIRGTAFTCDNINYWELLGVGTGTITPNKILYVNINGVSYGIPATDNLT